MWPVERDLSELDSTAPVGAWMSKPPSGTCTTGRSLSGMVMNRGSDAAQFGDRDAMDRHHLVWRGRQRRSAARPQHDRCDHVSRARRVVVEPADERVLGEVQPELLVDLAQRGRQRVLSRVEAAAWQRPLPGMGVEPRRPPAQQERCARARRRHRRRARSPPRRACAHRARAHAGGGDGGWSRSAGAARTRTRSRRHRVTAVAPRRRRATPRWPARSGRRRAGQRPRPRPRRRATGRRARQAIPRAAPAVVG